MQASRVVLCLIAVGIFDAQAADTAKSGITVGSAAYGYTKRLDVTGRVKELCDGKPTCQLTATNEFFGSDPEPGVRKELHIRWTCGASPEAKGGMMLEGTTFQVLCP